MNRPKLTTITVKECLSRINKETLISYKGQRNYIWTLKIASNYINSVLKYGVCGAIEVYKREATGDYEYINGLQRLTTFLRFSEALLHVDPKKLDRNISYFTDNKGIKAEKYVMNNLPKEFREDLLSAQFQLAIYSDRYFTNDDARQIFDQLNVNGRNINYDERNNNMYQGYFNDYLDSQLLNEDLIIHGLISDRSIDTQIAKQTLTILAMQTFTSKLTHDRADHIPFITTHTKKPLPQKLANSIQFAMGCIDDVYKKTWFTDKHKFFASNKHSLMDLIYILTELKKNDVNLVMMQGIIRDATLKLNKDIITNITSYNGKKEDKLNRATWCNNIAGVIKTGQKTPQAKSKVISVIANYIIAECKINKIKPPLRLLELK